MEIAGCVFPIAFTGFVRSGDVDRVRPVIFPDGCGCQAQLDFMGGKIGHGMSPRLIGKLNLNVGKARNAI
jgi:hypothetical protein